MNKTVVFSKNGATVLNCRPIIYSKKNVVINPKATPPTEPTFWKLDGYKIIEMDRVEKLKVLSSVDELSHELYCTFLLYQKYLPLLLIMGLVYLLARR